MAMPRTRAECVSGPRPCPHVRCRFHLGVETSRRARPEDVETCALDVADRGPLTLDEVGKILGVTRERVRQIEVAALEKLQAPSARLVAGDGPAAALPRSRVTLRPS